MSLACKPDPLNTLYNGNNLDILRRYIEDKSIDLIYLDPPFNSNTDYNALFAEKDGTQAQDIRSFKQATKSKSKKKEDAKLF
jgi:site-specific DNA-methyltransferase (adenine-specific)